MARAYPGKDFHARQATDRAIAVFLGGGSMDLHRGSLDQLRGIGGDSSIGRNSPRRSKDAALEMLNRITDIHPGKA